MHIEGVALTKVLGTFDAVEGAEAWEIFGSLGLFVKSEVSRILEVGFDLIEVTVSESVACAC